MSGTTLNLNKLKDEIDNRKQSRMAVNESNNAAPARDSFLNGLLESLHTGKETPATALVKSVDNLVGEKNGDNKRMTINETAPNRAPNRTPDTGYAPNPNIGQSPDRDDLLYKEFENRAKGTQTLGETLNSYATTPTMGAPMTPSIPPPNGHYPPNNGGGAVLNEAYLAESVKNIVDGRLIESMGPIMEEAMKNTIVEMYAIERIKAVLNENTDLIRSVVISTIKEIQQKNKKK